MPTVALRVFRGRRVFVNSSAFARVLERHLDTVIKPRFIQEFKRYVAQWKHAPSFKARKFVTQDGVRINVFPAGPHKDIFKFVTQGTPPHTITVKRAPYLSFQTDYQARTKPGNLDYRGPGKATGPWRAALSVQHPGTEPRNVEESIKDKLEPWFRRSMENATRRAVRSMQK